MNAKVFLFWASVGIVTLAGSYLLIRWFVKQEQRELAQKERDEARRLAERPRQEAGFHAIAKLHAPATT